MGAQSKENCGRLSCAEGGEEGSQSGNPLPHTVLNNGPKTGLTHTHTKVIAQAAGGRGAMDEQQHEAPRSDESRAVSRWRRKLSLGR